ncbi:12268_t:CDS:2, partial [Entrophospora sp. SA101]
RLDRLIYIKPPNFQERLSILNLLSKRFNFNNNQINFHEISLKTQSFTGADLKFLLERAAFIAFKKYKLNKSQTDFKVGKQINQTDILEALSTFQPSISLKQLGKYDKFKRGGEGSEIYQGCIWALEESNLIKSNNHKFFLNDISVNDYICNKPSIAKRKLEAGNPAATTNNPEKIDNSLLRPGRLDRLIYIKPPNFQERLSILNLLSKRFNFNNNQINFHEISLKTQSFTGADLKFLLERAAFIAFKKYKLNKSQTDFKVGKQINQTDILEALSTFQPSISLKQLGKYDKFSQSFI